MAEELILLPILIPIVAGISIFTIRFTSIKRMQIYIFIAVLLNSIFTILLLFNAPNGSFNMLEITDTVTLVLSIDGLGSVFAFLVAFMWPFATMYAFEYMKHEKNLPMFFAFYTVSYGVTMGIAFSDNPLTMYLFYEFLTLVTTPLVLHSQDRKAVKAARKYLFYSISGAAIGFISVAFVIVYGLNGDFVYGGNPILYRVFNEDVILNVTYILAFMGFGVKAAVFPFHAWLPVASVAPTPVTALLHAVAVVKAGAFVVIRMTYYVYGADNLRGTYAQSIVLTLAAITVIYASFMAVKEQHFKRRLAYSTISNLSYIMLAVAVMTNLGLYAALIHIIFHAIMKINAFFSAGAIMEQSGAHYINELEGMGKKMPFTYICFSISALSLMGMPLLVGFVSKYYLINSAIDLDSNLSYLMIIALFISAVLTAVYMLVIVVKAFFPRQHIVSKDASDPGIMMKLPIGVFASMVVIFGIYSTPILNYLEQVANGII